MSAMDRREFLKISGALGAAAAVGPLARLAAAADAAHASRPNILVFLTDDHGQWAQHAYGNAELKTPHLDQLAARGTRMTQTFTTCPVCSPARASFFTGRMPSQHGIHDWVDDSIYKNQPGLQGQHLLPELLKAAGYHTGLVGKWHCGQDHQPQPGFDRWFSYWIHQYPHRGTQNFSDQGKHIVEEGQQSPLLTQRAIDFLRDHRKDHATAANPFFLFVGYVDTHSPHKDAPDDLVQKYHDATFGDIPDEKFLPIHGRTHIAKAAKPEVEHTHLAEYYGAVSSIDREVGKILAELEANGQLENTLIVYTGDHGLNTGHHGMWEKGNGTNPQNFLEESIRVACTISWPAGGIRQNVTCDDMVNHCDLFATLLEIAGATPDAATAKEINSPGRSYASQLRGRAAANWGHTQISEYGNARMIRTDHYKLILRYPYAGVTFSNELYDLQADPRETINRYDDASLQGIIKDLTGQVDKFFEQYTVAGHSGLDLKSQPKFNGGEPWAISARKQ
jgi:choline-sulfatase